MRTSQRGIALLKEFESRRLVAYKCPAGVWTIGDGFTKNVKQGDVMTDAQCDDRLRREIREYEMAVLASTDANVTQNEFDALVCLAWNIGITGMRGSSVIKAHCRGDKVAAARAFGLWNKVKGRVLTGLTRRRAAEAALYLTPVEGSLDEVLELPMPQLVDEPKPLTSSTTVVAGGTAAIATVTQIADQVGKLKGSVASLDEWLMPVIAVVALVAIGWVIYERFKNRQRGAI